MKRLIQRAKEEAEKSHGVGRSNSYRVGACLFNGPYVIKAKHNSYKTHPSLLSYTPYPYLHAEAACILGHGIDNCRNLNLLVVRVRCPNNQLTMAKPCESCMRLIKDAKVNQVFFTDWKGELQCLT